MLGKPAFPLWESHYLLSVSNTCKQQAVGYLSKKKHSAWGLHRAAFHCSGETREVINGMLQWSIWLGPRMRFPFGKIWCSGCELGVGRSHIVLHIVYSASCGVRPTWSQWLASEADYFLCAIGTVHKAVENGECHWVAQFLLLELITNCCGSWLQFGYYPWTLKVLIRLYSSYFLMSLSNLFYGCSWFTSEGQIGNHGLSVIFEENSSLPN